jgi:hypothetical protein
VVKFSGDLIFFINIQGTKNFFNMLVIFFLRIGLMGLNSNEALAERVVKVLVEAMQNSLIASKEIKSKI